MRTSFAVFLHYLQMSGIPAFSVSLDGQASFSSIKLYTQDVPEKEDILYLCSPACLPENPRVPVILACSGNANSCSELKKRKVSALLNSDHPLQDIYIDLLHAYSEYLIWKSDMLQAASSDREPQHLIDLSETLFTFPLAIFDEMGVLVAHTNQIASDYEPFVELLEKKHALPEVLQRITASPAISAFTIAEGPHKNTHLEQALLDSGSKNIYRNCCLRDKVIYRCCFFCHTQEPSPENLAFIEEFFSLLEQCIAIHHDIFAQSVHGIPFLLMTLLSGSFEDAEYIRFCLAQNQIPAEGDFVLVGIFPEHPKDAEGLLKNVQENLALPWSLIYADSVQILINSQFLSKKLKELSPVLSTGRAIAVVSDPFSDIFRLSEAYALVKKAFALTRRLHPINLQVPFFQGKTRILFCSEIYSYLLLETGEIRPEALLNRLTRYIAASPLKKEDILKTIYVHIANGCKYNVTAQLLELHRNTVTNRIKQFEDALQVSFDDFEDCLNLILAIKTMEL